jgi:hypothetical protein
MRGAWAAFAKDPIKGLPSYDGWPNYNPNGTTLIRLAYGSNPLNGNGSVAGFAVGPSLAYDEDCQSV